SCTYFVQAEDGLRDRNVTGVQTCALPISTTTHRPGTHPETTHTRRRRRSRRTVRPITYRANSTTHTRTRDTRNKTQNTTERNIRSEKRREGKERRYTRTSAQYKNRQSKKE